MRAFDPYFTLQKLEVFCLVVELQSVTRASERLCVAQPVVTAHLRGLETKLGVTLVKRVGRNIGLTEAGERVYKWANDVVMRTREMERELSGLEDGVAGSAVLAASMTAGSYLLPALISSFAAAHPKGHVRLDCSNARAALDAVRGSACDFAVLVIHPSENLDGLIVEKLWDEPLLLASAPNSKLIGEVARPEDLKGLPFISGPRYLVWRELVEAQLRSYGVETPNVILEFGHAESQKHSVRSDLGLCYFLETSIRAELARGELRVVNTPGMQMVVPLYLAYRREKEFSPFQTSLIDHIRSSDAFV
jgi:LysR family transcriptional regulator, low CO2-responsive transcriptional regulator